METIRRQIVALLTEDEQSALDISQKLRMREKDVFEHLTHIKKTLSAQKKRLVINPARCLECNYSFESRNRFTKPGRCPRCKGEHIQDPKYRVV